MYMRVVFIRHAESRFNIGIQEYDSVLTETGKQQASKLMGNYPLILLSPMKRCLETLQYSRITSDNVYTWDILREHKTEICDFFENEEMIIETDDELTERCDHIIEEFIRLKQDILVITHHDIIANITGMKLDNAQMTMIEF